MTKNRRYFVLFLCLVGIAAVVAIPAFRTKDTDRLPVALLAIHAGKGWGYEIKVDGKTFIRQTNIPAVQGEVAFATRNEALLVGRHAMDKLLKGRLPQITLQELEEWGIVKDAVN